MCLRNRYHAFVGEPPTSALLLFDGLGRTECLARSDARRAVELILTRRFGHVVDRAYVRRVLDSFTDDPVRFRPFRYQKPTPEPVAVRPGALSGAFAMVRPPRHEIHHVRERGYFERPVRVQALCESLGATGLFTSVALKPHGRGPRAACGALLFSSVVDDPEEPEAHQEYLDELDKLPGGVGLPPETPIGSGRPPAGTFISAAVAATARKLTKSRLVSLSDHMSEWDPKLGLELGPTIDAKRVDDIEHKSNNRQLSQGIQVRDATLITPFRVRLLRHCGHGKTPALACGP